MVQFGLVLAQKKHKLGWFSCQELQTGQFESQRQGRCLHPPFVVKLRRMFEVFVQVPLYVHDDDDPSPWPVRGAGLWWRHVAWHLLTFSTMSQSACLHQRMRDAGSRIARA